MRARPPASGIRTGGLGVNPPPLLTIEKNKKTLFLEPSAFFYTEISEIAVMFFSAIELAYQSQETFVVMQ